MRVSTSPRKRNALRPPEKSAPGFLQWLRGRECLVANGTCEGKIEAAHVDYAGGKGVGTKVADRHTVPLCSLHHRCQHDKGWATFERKHFGADGWALKAAEAYWLAWPGRLAWQRKLEAGE